MGQLRQNNYGHKISNIHGKLVNSTAVRNLNTILTFSKQAFKESLDLLTVHNVITDIKYN